MLMRVHMKWELLLVVKKTGGTGLCFHLVEGLSLHLLSLLLLSSKQDESYLVRYQWDFTLHLVHSTSGKQRNTICKFREQYGALPAQPPIFAFQVAFVWCSPSPSSSFATTRCGIQSLGRNRQRCAPPTHSPRVFGTLLFRVGEPGLNSCKILWVFEIWEWFPGLVL